MRGRLIVASLLVVVGIVWIGQGTGVLAGSGFMVDDLRWAAIGAVLLVVGAILGVSAWRSRPRA